MANTSSSSGATTAATCFQYNQYTFYGVFVEKINKLVVPTSTSRMYGIHANSVHEFATFVH